MKEQLLEVVGLLQFLAFRGRIIAAVIKPGRIFSPGHAGKLDPLQMVGVVCASVYVPHKPLGPVRACLGQPVGHVFAVVADRRAGQRHRAVGGQRVRVQQHARRGVQALGDIQNALGL